MAFYALFTIKKRVFRRASEFQGGGGGSRGDFTPALPCLSMKEIRLRALELCRNKAEIPEIRLFCRDHEANRGSRGRRGPRAPLTFSCWSWPISGMTLNRWLGNQGQFRNFGFCRIPKNSISKFYVMTFQKLNISKFRPVIVQEFVVLPLNMSKVKMEKNVRLRNFWFPILAARAGLHSWWAVSWKTCPARPDRCRQ